MADLIVLISAMPEAIVSHHLLKRQWVLGQAGCAILVFGNFLGINASSTRYWKNRFLVFQANNGLFTFVKCAQFFDESLAFSVLLWNDTLEYANHYSLKSSALWKGLRK